MRTEENVGRTYHVVSLKHLPLVASTISIQRKRTVFLAHVLLSKAHTSTNGDLSTDDTVASEKRRSENVHRATFSMGHADLTTKELTNDTLDSATTHDGKRVATIGRYDAVVLGDSTLKTN